MNSFFAGKKFLVTGASRGIGRALAKELSKSGGKVYALGRTKELLESLAQETSNIHPVVADLSDWEHTVHPDTTNAEWSSKRGYKQ